MSDLTSCLGLKKGESYGGIYVPTLAEAILNGELDGSYTGAHLNGIAVGNGCTGTEIGICGSGPQVMLLMSWYHKQHNVLIYLSCVLTTGYCL